MAISLRVGTGSRYTALTLLTLTYTFSFIDRSIIGIIGQAIKSDLKLNDTELGLLSGFSFALFYTFLGIPIARLADRWDRVSIVSISLVVWSGFTALSGYAQSFVQLFLLRLCVGIGEAGCSPPSHSLISDYFRSEHRATALSIYSFGIPLGTMVGAVAGGWLTDAFDWRMALIVVGLPGVILALIVRLAMSDPRTSPKGAAVRRPGAPFSLASELNEVRLVAKEMFLRRGSRNVVLGSTVMSVATYGIASFFAPFFIRAFELSFTEVGLVTGIVAGVSAGIGTLLGGVVTDRAGRRGAQWYAFVPAIGLALAAPTYVVAYMQESWQASAAALVLPGIFAYSCVGPTYAIVQNVVEAHQRATAAALLLFVINLFGLGFGPLLAGWLIDILSEQAFQSAGGFSGAAFAAICPGGAAPAGAALEIAMQCRNALIDGTRFGIISMAVFYVWAALHYFFAGGSIGDEMKNIN